MTHMSTSGRGYGDCRTRSAVLRVSLSRACASGVTSITAFSLTFIEHYVQLVPEPDRLPSLSHLPRGGNLAEYEADCGALRRQVSRLLDGTTRMPADLEPAWVRSLPEPFRAECLDALASMHGLLAVPQPEGTQILGGFGRFMQSSGATLAAMEPIVADGLLNTDDAEHIPEALGELQKLIRAAASLQARIEAVQRAAAGKPVAVTGRERAA